MEDINSYQAGNTVKLTGIFEDFEGNRINPSLVKVSIYNYKYEKLEENILGANNQAEIGKYFHYYTTSPTEEQRIVYEFYGEIEGLPSLKRNSFRTFFI